MSNFRKTKKWAWQYYKKWMKEKTFCKILGEEIRISRRAWNHLISRRSIKDKHSRMLLLKPAKHVLKNATKISITKRNGIEYTQLKGKARMGKRHVNIKIVLKRDQRGEYYLFSIMKT